ncbi:MAG: hypothetical protein HYR89_09850 [Actinobacteria bacterium]|nr:hypothetical protein [Actinomycetota bacterium]
MKHRLGRSVVRFGVVGVASALFGGLLVPLPVAAAAPKPKEVPALGVTGEAPAPVLERPEAIFENLPPGPSGVATGPGVVSREKRDEASGRIDPNATAVEEMTSETRRVVRSRDGALNAVVTAGPVRLKDKGGRWLPFDLSLARGARGLLRTQVSPVEVGFRDEVGAAGPTAEITLGEGVVLGLDLDVVAEGAKAEVIASKPIKDPTTAGYSPEDKAKCQPSRISLVEAKVRHVIP